jgi:hypothetical protein
MLHKIIKKVGPELHVFLNSVVLLFCVVLVLAVLVLFFKHEKLKIAMFYFADQAAIASKQRYVGADAVEDASALATTIATIPAEKPLFSDKLNLQKLVTSLSQQMTRHIIVEDTHQMILADSISSDIGKLYSSGLGNDAKTLKDGQVRRFTEHSSDYPMGVDEVVVPMKSSNGSIEGAVIMSTSRIFDDR